MKDPILICIGTTVVLLLIIFAVVVIRFVTKANKYYDSLERNLK